MSIESSQFAQMIREGVKQKPGTEGELFFRYCENCCGQTPHNSEEQGEWEIFTCTRCSGEKKYRTR